MRDVPCCGKISALYADQIQVHQATPRFPDRTALEGNRSAKRYSLTLWHSNLTEAAAESRRAQPASQSVPSLLERAEGGIYRKLAFVELHLSTWIATGNIRTKPKQQVPSHPVLHLPSTIHLHRPNLLKATLLFNHNGILKIGNLYNAPGSNLTTTR